MTTITPRILAAFAAVLTTSLMLVASFATPETAMLAGALA